MQRIKAKVLSSGTIVNVYQTKSGDKYFIDEDNNPYTAEELDFTVEQPSAKDNDASFTNLFGIHPIGQPDAFQWNDMSFKLEKARKEMEKEIIRLNFKCQLVTIFFSRIDSAEVSPAFRQGVMDLVNYFEQKIFDNNDTD